MRAIPFLFLLLVAPFAGCIDDSSDPAGGLPDEVPMESFEDIYGRVAALMEGVPCEVDSIGDETSENLKDLALPTIGEGAGTASLDFFGDIMVAASSGLAILNISDPLAPEVITVFGDHGFGDVKISRDGATVIGGAGDKIELIDIRDPEEPVLVGEWSLSAPGHPDSGFTNAHMLYTAIINEEHWVFLAPNNNDGIWILKMTGPPEARTLEYVTSTLPVEGGPLGPHDLWLNYDAKEEGGKWLLYSADGYHGWTVFDVSDPANPEIEGGVVRPETGYTHTIQGTRIGEKRIVATIGEVGFNLLEIYDATDLKAPVLLGAWHLNMQTGTVPQPLAPQHEFNIVDGKLYLGYYANGFFVFDIEPLASSLPVVGSLDIQPMAHYKAGTPSTTGLFSDIWSVDVINGILYASSMADGVHVVGFGCNEPGNVALTSTG